MSNAQIHITGAAGCGVTTLGAALAERLGITQFDTDDYYWMPTVPPFRQKRDIPDRLRLLHAEFSTHPGWVLSGAMESWGDPLVPLLDLIIFMQVPTPVRLERLRARESIEHGAANCASGGWRHEETEEFLEWAAHYEDGTREGRTLQRHEDWLATVTCPVLRLNGIKPGSELVQETMAALRD